MSNWICQYARCPCSRGKVQHDSYYEESRSRTGKDVRKYAGHVVCKRCAEIWTVHQADDRGLTLITIASKRKCEEAERLRRSTYGAFLAAENALIAQLVEEATKQILVLSGVPEEYEYLEKHFGRAPGYCLETYINSRIGEGHTFQYEFLNFFRQTTPEYLVDLAKQFGTVGRFEKADQVHGLAVIAAVAAENERVFWRPKTRLQVGPICRRHIV